MNNRIQSMDFLRSWAVISVIIGHGVLSYGSPSNLTALQFGGSGVDLFFVLSGWLLGGQLFKELKVNQHIDVKRFWYRRWMRTLPAYYAVLIVTVAQRYITKDDVSFPLDYFIFVQNYNAPMEFFSVSWSLCVEEQFYLAIAPLLLFSKQIKTHYTTLFLLIVFFVPEVFRSLDLYGFKNETHVRLDGCILGVLLANIKYNYVKVWEKLIANITPVFVLSVGIYFLSFYMKAIGHTNILPPGKLFLTMIFGCWVIFANSNSPFVRLLCIPGSQFIATRAYALYLLHPEALAMLNRLNLAVPYILYLVIALVISFALAEVLYRLVEKPFMDMREKLPAVQHKAMAAK